MRLLTTSPSVGAPVWSSSSLSPSSLLAVLLAMAAIFISFSRDLMALRLSLEAACLSDSWPPVLADEPVLDGLFYGGEKWRV